MGFFSDLSKAFVEGYENGKVNYNKQCRWKNEERIYKEDQKTNNKKNILEEVLKAKDIIRLKLTKREIELKLKYGDLSNDEKKELKAADRELSDEIRRLKKNISNEASFAEEDTNDFVENYILTREKRVALCINYILNPKSLEQTKLVALEIIMMSPICKCYEDVKNDYINMKERFRIYKNFLNNENNLSALEYCFFNHLVIDAEMPFENGKSGEQWYLNTISYVMGCDNTLRYNDDNYGTHFTQLNFYGLSAVYNDGIKNIENEIMYNAYKIYMEMRDR